MATWDDVADFARTLPEVTVGPHFGNRGWRVRTKSFAWERPLTGKDVAELGDAAPAGQILGVRTTDVDEQLALVSGEADYVFITTHFAGYPAVLVQLDRIPVGRLREMLTDAWIAVAPKRLAKAFLDESGPD